MTSGGQKLFITKKWNVDFLDTRGGWFQMAESYRNDMNYFSKQGLVKNDTYPQFLYAVNKAKVLTVYGR